MSASYMTITINQGDTLEGLAQRHLGDWTRWKEIAALNALRYPFISDRPERWFGTEVSTGTLSGDLDALALTVLLLGERKEVLLSGSTFFVDGYLSNDAGNNTYAWDATIIQSYDPTTGTVVFSATATQIQHNWPQGTRYRVFPPASDTLTHVARPGEKILLPIATSDTGSILDNTNSTNLYGTDIALERDGKLTLSNGDLTTVSGFDNMSQALRFRAELPYGNYLVHTDEGNRCYFLIGEPVRPETSLRAASFIKEALETDPRVVVVSNVVSDVSQPDEIRIGATVQLARSEDQVTVNTLLRNRQ